MAEEDEVIAVEDQNPQRREQGPRRQRLGRWSTGARRQIRTERPGSRAQEVP